MKPIEPGDVFHYKERDGSPTEDYLLILGKDDSRDHSNDTWWSYHSCKHNHESSINESYLLYSQYMTRLSDAR